MKYFAYGSNMLTRRLTDPSRAPSAVACGIAGAPGFVVRFYKMGADGSGKCTLVATGNDAAEAYGVLYELAESDGARLDGVEGVHTGGYKRCSVQLRCITGDAAVAMTYVANDLHVDPASVPFDWYRDLVVAGALEHGLPARYVDELARTPAKPDPNTERVARARRLLDRFLNRRTRETKRH